MRLGERTGRADDHWDNLRRSKSYISDSYFPPRNLRDGNLMEMFETKESIWRSDQSNNGCCKDAGP